MNLTRFYIIWITVVLFGLFSCKQSESKVVENESIKSSPELKTVLVNGYNIHYMDVGKGEPVVFVHGHLGDYTTWSRQMDTFSANHRVIAYSRRYANPNRQVINDTADYTIMPHVKDLAELIKTLQLGQVNLIGHSYGAFTALKTTIDHPELVKTLTLGEPPVMSLLSNMQGGDTLISTFSNKALKPAAEAFKNNENEKAISLFISGAMGKTINVSEVSEPLRKHWLNNALDLRGFVINEAFIPLSPETIGSLEKPVLVIKGEASPVRFQLIADELHRLLPNSTLFELSESSHGLQGENPEVFNKTVLKFIDKN